MSQAIVSRHGIALDCVKGSSDKHPPPSQQSLAFGKYQIQGPDATRMCTAMIPGELHLVVRLYATTLATIW